MRKVISILCEGDMCNSSASLSSFLPPPPSVATCGLVEGEGSLWEICDGHREGPFWIFLVDKQIDTNFLVLILNESISINFWVALVC